MSDFDDLFPPRTREYVFTGVRGTPTLRLRPLDVDNHAFMIDIRAREGRDPVKPSSVDELRATRVKEAGDLARWCVDSLVIAGRDRTEDAVAFLSALALTDYARLNDIFKAAQVVETEARTDAIAGE